MKANFLHQYNPGLILDLTPNAACVSWFSTLLNGVSFPGCISPSLSLQATSLVVLQDLGSQIVKTVAYACQYYKTMSVPLRTSLKSCWPFSTLSPSLTKNSAMTPAEGAETGMLV